MSANWIWLLCGGFFIFAFFVAGVIMIIFGIRNRKKGTESQEWPRVTGTITNVNISKDTDTDAEGFTTVTYKPEIEYQYEIGGNQFTSTRVSFGGTRTYNSYKKAEEATAKYPLDGAISVFYNPQQPEEAVLEQGTKGTMALIIAGIVFLGISMIASCVGLFMLFYNL